MFGDNLKKYRIQNGYSQNDLALKLFVTRQCVSKWEKGITQPDLQTLNKICELLNVSADALIKGEQEQVNKKQVNLNLYLLVANILFAAFCVLSFAVLCRFMPNTIPAHWSHGMIDRYGRREEILINIITVITFLTLDIIIYIYGRRIKNIKPLCVVHIVTILFQMVNLFVIIALYVKYLISMSSFCSCISAGIMFCLSIAINPKICKQNYFFGVRTKSTLDSKDVWYKTNALASFLYSGFSIVIFVVNMILIFNFSYISLLTYLIPTIFVLIYSKVISTKIK